MTSTDVAPPFVRDLNFAGRGAATRASTRFAFDEDFDSPAAFADLPYDPAASTSRHVAEERAALRAVVGRAGATLGRHAPDAFDFVDAQLQRVMLRRSERLPGAGSSSNRDHVGICVLTNLDRAGDGGLTCVEALVHESVHQYLYRAEQARGPFCDLDASRRYRSPWSGNRIPLHSFVHACFVYYALLTLWCRLAAVSRADPPGSVDANAIDDRLTRHLFGYAFVESILDGATFPRHLVHPAVLDAIRRIARASRAARVVVADTRTVANALDADRSAAIAASLAAIDPAAARASADAIR